MKATILFLFLALIFASANSARLLDEVEAQPQVIADPQEKPNPALVAAAVPSAATLPSGQIPAAAAPGTAVDETQPVDDAAPPVDDVAPTVADAPEPDPVTVAPPVDDAAPTVADAQEPDPVTVAPPVAGVTPTVAPTTSSPSGPATVAATSATEAKPAGPGEDPALSFFMHDIIGGSHPSARVVSGIIANTEINGIPFSKLNNNIFPLNGGTPLVNLNNINKLINPNNAPLLTGLNGAQTNTIIQNAGANNNFINGDNQPFITAGQLPPGATLQRLMFGSITVVDDEMTEGHELGSAVIGRAQGFYLASSLDGTSHTVALTILLHGDHDHHDYDDTISFFGVHRAVSHESHIAVVGGTGKFENAKGYATIETLHQEDQHTTDGVDTILHCNVYLTE